MRRANNHITVNIIVLSPKKLAGSLVLMEIDIIANFVDISRRDGWGDLISGEKNNSILKLKLFLF